MFYLVPPDCQQVLLAYLKTWIKGITLLPIIISQAASLLLLALALLLQVPADTAAEAILNSLGEAYVSMAVPLSQFWITAYLLAALIFVTGWESARPASWRLPLLFLLPWYDRLRRMLPRAINFGNALPLAAIPAFDRSRFFPPGPPGLTPPALCAGIVPLRE